MNARFNDRLAPSTYENDVEVLIAARSSTGNDEIATWLPERLLERASALGAAYELHHVSRLLHMPEINSIQCDALCEEIDFLSDVLIKDSALIDVLMQLRRVAEHCMRSAGPTRVVIDLP